MRFATIALLLALPAHGAGKEKTATPEAIPLKTVLAYATNIPANRIAGPAWLDTELFPVPKPVLRQHSDESRAELLRQLRSRLALEFHHERRRHPGFHARPTVSNSLEIRPAKSAGEPGTLTRNGTPVINTTSHLRARGVTFAEVCRWLERQLGAPVQPAADLPAGAWDFHLRWRTGEPSSLIAAARNQLGLELTLGDTTAEYLVIDRIEKP